ncbi:UbiX family flavin prenyltransferase [Hypericibacter sp.]|uniref:UbiX family flavin prenyltransferase n=1 Tax=Hypericibacter sp. TaxID=2705401 RepID=UPI003D6CE456
MTRRNPKESAVESPPTRLIVGMSGASGAILGIRMLQALRPLPVEVHLVISRAAELTIAYETDMKVPEVRALADATHGINEMAAPISSGSFPTLGMVIAPCSIKTMSEIATGVTSSLLTRAADVTLKERRRLVLMLRETPLHTGHLRNLTALSEMGAIIAPPVPAFYARPKTIEEMVDHSVGRVCDLFGLETGAVKRWHGPPLSPRSRKTRGIGEIEED